MRGATLDSFISASMILSRLGADHFHVRRPEGGHEEDISWLQEASLTPHRAERRPHLHSPLDHQVGVIQPVRGRGARCQHARRTVLVVRVCTREGGQAAIQRLIRGNQQHSALALNLRMGRSRYHDKKILKQCSLSTVKLHEVTCPNLPKDMKTINLFISHEPKYSPWLKFMLESGLRSSEHLPCMCHSYHGRWLQSSF